MSTDGQVSLLCAVLSAVSVGLAVRYALSLKNELSVGRSRALFGEEVVRAKAPVSFWWATGARIVHIGACLMIAVVFGGVAVMTWFE